MHSAAGHEEALAAISAQTRSALVASEPGAHLALTRPFGSGLALEHAVGVGGLLRNLLHDVPVFDDLAVLQPENVNDGAAARACFGHAVNMQDHVVVVREGALDLAARVRKFFPQESEEGLETFDTVRRR